MDLAMLLETPTGQICCTAGMNTKIFISSDMISRFVHVHVATVKIHMLLLYISSQTDIQSNLVVYLWYDIVIKLT